MALEGGGRSDEALLASGVLLRFPILWLDMLSMRQGRIRVGDFVKLFVGSFVKDRRADHGRSMEFSMQGVLENLEHITMRCGKEK